MLSCGFFRISLPLPPSCIPAFRFVLPRLFSSSSFTPTQQELVREQRRIEGLKKNDFFGENERLVNALKNAKENSRNHIVFLEGPPGAGKTVLLSRLHNLGYQILAAPSYIELCKATQELNPVKGSLLPFSWSTQYFATLEPILKTAIRKEANGTRVTTPTPKDNIVFVSCSILTPWLLHGKNTDRDLEYYYQGIWQEIRDNYDCSLIYCKCFDQVIAQRLGQAFLYADEKEQEVRTMLGEADFESISKLLERYENLLTSDLRKDGSSLADAVVYTVSTKQSVPALLSTFGLKPPPIPTFDFSHLQKRR